MKVIAVLHITESHGYVRDQCLVARDAGADGVVLINHRGNDLDTLAQVIQLRRSPILSWGAEFRLGANLLSCDPELAYTLVSGVQDGLRPLFVWSDRPFAGGIAIKGGPLRYGPCAFKYQRSRASLASQALDAAITSDAVVTSGLATGHAPAVEKLAEIDAALRTLPNQPELWNASGTTVSNLEDMAPFIDGVFVATSVTAEDGRFDYPRLLHLVRTAHAIPKRTRNEAPQLHR